MNKSHLISRSNSKDQVKTDYKKHTSPQTHEYVSNRRDFSRVKLKEQKRSHVEGVSKETFLTKKINNDSATSLAPDVITKSQ